MDNVILVLVVGTDPSLGEEVERVKARFGLSFVQADDCAEAQAFLRTIRFGAVVLEAEPVEEALALIERLRGERHDFLRRLPVILVADKTSEVLAPRREALDSVVYLEKPLTNAELVRALERVLTPGR